MANTLLTARQMEARKNVLWNLAHLVKGVTIVSVGIDRTNDAGVTVHRGERDPIRIDGQYEAVRDELKRITKAD